MHKCTHKTRQASLWPVLLQYQVFSVPACCVCNPARITGSSDNSFPGVIDFQREFTLHLCMICDLSRVRYPWCEICGMASKRKNDLVCRRMCRVCVYMSVFVTFRHLVMLHLKVGHYTWCSFHELLENSFTVPSRMLSVDVAVRCVAIEVY